MVDVFGPAVAQQLQGIDLLEQVGISVGQLGVYSVALLDVYNLDCNQLPSLDSRRLIHTSKAALANKLLKLILRGWLAGLAAAFEDGILHLLCIFERLLLGARHVGPSYLERHVAGEAHLGLG
jgi:hypothetical protein